MSSLSVFYALILVKNDGFSWEWGCELLSLFYGVWRSLNGVINANLAV